MERKTYKPPHIDLSEIEEDDELMQASVYTPDVPIDEGEEWDDAKKGFFFP